ncbi:MAG: thermonuclease family protein [Thermoguttaceae bacterium]
MSTILSLALSKSGLYLGLALAIFVGGFWLCWKWERRAENKTYTHLLAVADVANGATIQAKSGLLGRSTRPVFVAGIAAPGLNDPLGPQSRDNLKSLVGETIRVESETRGLFAEPLVGQVFGDTGADVGIAQLRAGLAKCESQATKDQIAAQREAQKAARGLWETTGGSHWWHFGAAAEEFPEPIPLVEPEPSMLDLQTAANVVMIVTALIVAAILFWTYVGAPLWSKTTAGAAVNTAVDVTEQISAYTALTLIRNVPAVASDSSAVAACELLCTKVMVWPKSTAQ